MLTIIERDQILWPVAVHLTLILFLYGWLSLVRKQLRDGRDVAALEARISANLSNQFEAPVLFYAALAMIWSSGLVNTVYVALAWVFVAGRVWHMVIATQSTDVIRRGLVFTVNFLAIYAIWALFLIRQLVL